jgi:nucleolar protein 56
MEQREFLRKQMLKKTREQIEEKFAGKEIHIIKAINLLSDLESINNLMGENVSEWKLRQPTGEAEKEFLNLEKNVKNINEQKEKLTEFIQKEMNTEFPNFSTIATPIIGAKLLASAGSKKRLCFAPASTIQVLGAEKALFNHIKHKARCPKHGHLFNHPLLQRLPKQKRGKAARIMAGKLSIALKQDYFNGENTSKEVIKELEKIIEKISNEPEKIKKPNFSQQKNNSEHKTFTLKKEKHSLKNRIKKKFLQK